MEDEEVMEEGEEEERKEKEEEVRQMVGLSAGHVRRSPITPKDDICAAGSSKGNKKDDSDDRERKMIVMTERGRKMIKGEEEHYSVSSLGKDWSAPMLARTPGQSNSFVWNQLFLSVF